MLPRKQDSLIVIEPNQGMRLQGILDIWDFRELLFALVTRDLKVRYKQTALGVAWVLLQPLIGAVIFSFIFGRFAKMPSEGLPYPAFVLVGLIVWTFFSNSVSQAANSLVAQQNLITKVYFPRAIIPLSVTCTAVFDLFVSMFFGYLILLKYHPPTFTSLVVLPILFCLVLWSGGLGVLLSALVLRFRDIKHIIPFFLQLFMYATPIVYSSDIVPLNFKWIVFLNPLAVAIEEMRNAFFDRPVSALNVVLLGCFSLFVLITGLTYFSKIEKDIADIV